MAFYSREHYRRVSPPADSDWEIRLRAIDAECRAKAESDANERFGRVVPSDASTLLARHNFWEQRVAYWRDALGAWPSAVRS